jgi:hypothetical protein
MIHFSGGYDDMAVRRKSVEPWSRDDLFGAAKVMVQIAGGSIAGIGAVYFVRFDPQVKWLRELLFNNETNKHFTDAQAAWGQFGEFVGGTVGPVLSALAFVGLVFTLLLQHEAMMRVQQDSANSLKALSDQTRLSLEAARLQALTSALAVTSELHAQTVAAGAVTVAGALTAQELTSQKEMLACKIIQISDLLDRRADADDVASSPQSPADPPVVP